MTGPISVAARKPRECHDTEIADFMALVMAGGEVTPNGLEGRVRSAACLAFLTIGCCLSGVAALKRPEASYRKRVAAGSGIALPEAELPYELGWVFVMPNARGRGFSADLTRAALSGADDDGVFATSRTENDAMHATLAKFHFTIAGRPYPSGRGGHRLQLFVRRNAQPSVAADAPRAARR